MRKEKRAVLDRVVSKVSKVPRVTLVTEDPRDLVVVVPLAHRDHKASKDPKAAVANLVQELEVQLDPWAHEVNEVRWVSKDRRETLVHLDLKELLGAMASRVNVAPLAPWAELVCVDPRETRV